MDADNSFYVKFIATYAPTLFGYIISFLAIVIRYIISLWISSKKKSKTYSPESASLVLTMTKSWLSAAKKWSCLCISSKLTPSFDHVNLGLGLPDVLHSMTAVSPSVADLFFIGFTNLRKTKRFKLCIIMYNHEQDLMPKKETYFFPFFLSKWNIFSQYCIP